MFKIGMNDKKMLNVISHVNYGKLKEMLRFNFLDTQTDIHPIQAIILVRNSIINSIKEMNNDLNQQLLAFIPIFDKSNMNRLNNKLKQKEHIEQIFSILNLPQNYNSNIMQLFEIALKDPNIQKESLIISISYCCILWYLNKTKNENDFEILINYLIACLNSNEKLNFIINYAFKKLLKGSIKHSKFNWKPNLFRQIFSFTYSNRSLSTKVFKDLIQFFKIVINHRHSDSITEMLKLISTLVSENRLIINWTEISLLANQLVPFINSLDVQTLEILSLISQKTESYSLIESYQSLPSLLLNSLDFDSAESNCLPNLPRFSLIELNSKEFTFSHSNLFKKGFENLSFEFFEKMPLNYLSFLTEKSIQATEKVSNCLNCSSQFYQNHFLASFGKLLRILKQSSCAIQICAVFVLFMEHTIQSIPVEIFLSILTETVLFNPVHNIYLKNGLNTTINFLRSRVFTIFINTSPHSFSAFFSLANGYPFLLTEHLLRLAYMSYETLKTFIDQKHTSIIYQSAIHLKSLFENLNTLQQNSNQSSINQLNNESNLNELKQCNLIKNKQLNNLSNSNGSEIERNSMNGEINEVSKGQIFDESNNYKNSKELDEIELNCLFDIEKCRKDNFVLIFKISENSQIFAFKNSIQYFVWFMLEDDVTIYVLNSLEKGISNFNSNDKYDISPTVYFIVKLLTSIDHFELSIELSKSIKNGLFKNPSLFECFEPVFNCLLDILNQFQNSELLENLLTIIQMKNQLQKNLLLTFKEFSILYRVLKRFQISNHILNFLFNLLNESTNITQNRLFHITCPSFLPLIFCFYSNSKKPIEFLNRLLKLCEYSDLNCIACHDGQIDFIILTIIHKNSFEYRSISFNIEFSNDELNSIVLPLLFKIISIKCDHSICYLMAQIISSRNDQFCSQFITSIIKLKNLPQPNFLIGSYDPILNYYNVPSKIFSSKSFVVNFELYLDVISMNYSNCSLQIFSIENDSQSLSLFSDHMSLYLQTVFNGLSNKKLVLRLMPVKGFNKYKIQFTSSKPNTYSMCTVINNELINYFDLTFPDFSTEKVFVNIGGYSKCSEKYLNTNFGLISHFSINSQICNTDLIQKKNINFFKDDLYNCVYNSLNVENQYNLLTYLANENFLNELVKNSFLFNHNRFNGQCLKLIFDLLFEIIPLNDKNFELIDLIKNFFFDHIELLDRNLFMSCYSILSVIQNKEFALNWFEKIVTNIWLWSKMNGENFKYVLYFYSHQLIFQNQIYFKSKSYFIQFFTQFYLLFCMKDYQFIFNSINNQSSSPINLISDEINSPFSNSNSMDSNSFNNQQNNSKSISPINSNLKNAEINSPSYNSNQVHSNSLKDINLINIIENKSKDLNKRNSFNTLNQSHLTKSLTNQFNSLDNSIHHFNLFQLDFEFIKQFTSNELHSTDLSNSLNFDITDFIECRTHFILFLKRLFLFKIEPNDIDLLFQYLFASQSSQTILIIYEILNDIPTSLFHSKSQHLQLLHSFLNGQKNCDNLIQIISQTLFLIDKLTTEKDINEHLISASYELTCYFYKNEMIIKPIDLFKQLSLQIKNHPNLFILFTIYALSDLNQEFIQLTIDVYNQIDEIQNCIFWYLWPILLLFNSYDMSFIKFIKRILVKEKNPVKIFDQIIDICELSMSQFNFVNYKQIKNQNLDELTNQIHQKEKAEQNLNQNEDNQLTYQNLNVNHDHDDQFNNRNSNNFKTFQEIQQNEFINEFDNSEIKQIEKDLLNENNSNSVNGENIDQNKNDLLNEINNKDGENIKDNRFSISFEIIKEISTIENEQLIRHSILRLFYSIFFHFSLKSECNQNQFILNKVVNSEMFDSIFESNEPQKIDLEMIKSPRDFEKFIKSDFDKFEIKYKVRLDEKGQWIDLEKARFIIQLYSKLTVKDTKIETVYKIIQYFIDKHSLSFDSILLVQLSFENVFKPLLPVYGQQFQDNIQNYSQLFIELMEKSSKLALFDFNSHIFIQKLSKIIKKVFVENSIENKERIGIKRSSIISDDFCPHSFKKLKIKIKKTKTQRRSTIIEFNCNRIKLNSIEKCSFKLFNDCVCLNDSKIIQLNDISMILTRKRNNQLKFDTLIEIFTVTGKSYLIDFLTVENTVIIQSFLDVPLNSIEFIQKSSSAVFNTFDISQLTKKWSNGFISNFDYIMKLNIISGRSFNDSNLYPIFPSILSDFNNHSIIRDFSTIQNQTTNNLFIDLFTSFTQDFTPTNIDQTNLISPDQINSPHTNPNKANSITEIKSNFIKHFNLNELNSSPISSNQIHSTQLNELNKLDINSVDVNRCKALNLNDVLIHNSNIQPEFFYLSKFIEKFNGLPTWATSTFEFIYLHRKLLESEAVSKILNKWVIPIFGKNQLGHIQIFPNNFDHPIKTNRPLFEIPKGKDILTAKISEIESAITLNNGPIQFKFLFVLKNGSVMSTIVNTNSFLNFTMKCEIKIDTKCDVKNIILTNYKGNFYLFNKDDRSVINLVNRNIDPTNLSNLANFNYVSKVDKQNIYRFASSTNYLFATKNSAIYLPDDTIISKIKFNGQRKTPMTDFSFITNIYQSNYKILMINASPRFHKIVFYSNDGLIHFISTTGLETNSYPLNNNEVISIEFTKNLGFVVILLIDKLLIFTIDGEFIKEKSVQNIQKLFSLDIRGIDYIVYQNQFNDLFLIECFYPENVKFVCSAESEVLCFEFDPACNGFIIVKKNGNISLIPSCI